MLLLGSLSLVLLVSLVAGGGVQPARAQAPPVPVVRGDASGEETNRWEGVRAPEGPDEDDCEDDPGACIAGTALAYMFGPLFAALFTDVRGTTQPWQAPLGIRLEHRFRAVGASSARSHPYLGLGVRFVRRELHYAGPHSPVEPYAEAAVGYQAALRPLLGTGSTIQRSAVLGTEVQWLSGSDGDRLRLEVAPGLELKRSSNRRLLVHLTLGVAVAGAEAGDVSPGLSLGYRW